MPTWGRGVLVGSACVASLISFGSSRPAFAQVAYCNGVRYWGACPQAYQPPPAPQGPTPAQIEQQRQVDLGQVNEAGIAAFNRGDYATALADFEQAARLSPYNPTIQHSIQRAREELAKQQAPILVPAKPLNEIETGTAPRGAYSQAVSAAAAPDKTTAYDAGAAAAPAVGLKFHKTPDREGDPVVPPERETADIRRLEAERDSARSEARAARARRLRLQALGDIRPARKREIAALERTEEASEQKVQHLNFGITAALGAPPGPTQ